MNDDQQSSLELLLDTITNTFGGILFLALLVVVLLQLTVDKSIPEAPQRETAERLVTLETELTVAVRQRDELLRTASIQDRLLKQFATESNRQELEQLKTARETMRAVETERLQLAGDLVSKQNEINSVAQEISTLNNCVKIQKTQVEDAKAKLQAEIRSRTTTAKLPKMHETRKAEIAVVLRYGRVYFVYRYDASLSSREVNTDDMVVVENGADELVATPKPYAGIAVENADVLRSDLRKKLQSFPPDAVYLAIAVWDDSFDKFIEFKNALIEIGYEYRVIPIESGGSVSESTDAKPRVQ